MPQNLCPEIRGRIVGQWQAGRTVAEIAAAIPCSAKTVRRWIQRFIDGGDHALHDHRHNNRGPRITRAEEDEAIVAAVAEQPFGSVQEALNAANVQVSERTARRRLNAAGYHCYRPARKIMLTPVNREQRIAFALENLVTSREEWEATIWTDEKVFVSSADRQPHVWRQRDQRLHPNHVVPLHRSGRISCGMWGWISGTAIGELVEIPPRMNSAEYIRILEDVFLPSVRAIYPVEDMPVIRLVQDNSGVHTSRETQQWFRNHPEIQLINWPARSPDLNLIENVWAQMVRRWEPRRERTVAALVNHAREIWDELRLRPDYLANLIDSIPNRLNQVIDRSGYWTDY